MRIPDHAADEHEECCVAHGAPALDGYRVRLVGRSGQMIGSVFLKRDLSKAGDDGDLLPCTWTTQVTVVCSDLTLATSFLLPAGFVSAS